MCVLLLSLGRTVVDIVGVRLRAAASDSHSDTGRMCGGEHVAGIVFVEEAVDLFGEDVEVDGFGEDGEGVEGESLGEESLAWLASEEDAGQEWIVLADDFEGLHAGEVVEDGVEDGEVDFAGGDEVNDVAGGVCDEGVDAARLKDGLDSLGPGPVGIAEQDVDAVVL